MAPEITQLLTAPAKTAAVVAPAALTLAPPAGPAGADGFAARLASALSAGAGRPEAAREGSPTAGATGTTEPATAPLAPPPAVAATPTPPPPPAAIHAPPAAPPLLAPVSPEPSPKPGDAEPKAVLASASPRAAEPPRKGSRPRRTERPAAAVDALASGAAADNGVGVAAALPAPPAAAPPAPKPTRGAARAPERSGAAPTPPPAAAPPSGARTAPPAATPASGDAANRPPTSAAVSAEAPAAPGPLLPEPTQSVAAGVAPAAHAVPSALPLAEAAAGSVVATPHPVPGGPPAPARAAPPSAAPLSTAAAASAQVATAVARLSAHAGRTQLDLSLHPAELGHVAIRIARAADGAASVTIHVERPATLALLHRETPQLQAALDRAGVASEGRSVALSLIAREPAMLSGQAGAGAPSPDAASWAFGEQGRAPDGQPRGRPARPRANAADAQTTVLAVALPTAPARPGARATDMLDITA
jgi:hypothetical protein